MVVEGQLHWEKVKENVIGLISRVFANGLGDQDPIRDQVILKTQKMVLNAALLNTQHHKAWIKGKVEQSRGWCSSFWKENLQVALDWGRHLYLLIST